MTEPPLQAKVSNFIADVVLQTQLVILDEPRQKSKEPPSRGPIDGDVSTQSLVVREYSGVVKGDTNL